VTLTTPELFGQADCLQERHAEVEPLNHTTLPGVVGAHKDVEAAKVEGGVGDPLKAPVRAEVDRCDLVAVRGGEPPVIVELKRRFALSLLYQGIERQRITDAVYLAVAAPTGRKARAIWDRKRGAVLQLCRRLGLGLMTVDIRDPCARQVDVHLDPAAYAPRKSRARREHLLGEFARRVADHAVPTASPATAR
jgi:hypothetical protein